MMKSNCSETEALISVQIVAAKLLSNGLSGLGLIRLKNLPNDVNFSVLFHSLAV